MLPCRPAWAVLALLVLLAPVAGAFAAREEPLSLAYPQDASPVVFATGAVRLDGDARGGILASGARDFLLRDVPELTVVERGVAGLPRETTHRGADLVVHSGIVAWSFGAASLDVDLRAAYGMGLSLPRIPIPGSPDGPGAILAAPGVDGNFSWRGAQADVVLLDAEASLLGPGGEPLPGWNRRSVNPGATTGADPNQLSVLLRARGAFDGVAHARILSVGVGNATDASLSVAPAAEDRFAETLDVLTELGELTGDPRGEEVFGSGNPLRALGGFSPVLNGALVVSGTLASGEEAKPLVSTVGSEPFDVGPLALLRGEMTLAWGEGRMSAEGTPVVALGRSGFAVEEAASIAGIVPLVAVLLWGAALAAIVFFFVKRPPRAEGGIGLRLASLAVHVLALVAVFWWWDRSFADTFGTSVLTLLFEGAAFDDLPRLGTVFALETLPWGLAALCFALPARILAGVALRYLGKGKAYKGIAKATGFVVLGLLGPLYALWLMNAVFGVLAPWMGSMLP